MTDPIGTGPLRHALGRRRFIVTVAGGLLAAPLPAEAQQAGKVPRIGYLFVGSSSVPSPASLANPFWLGMKELGWVEGQNLIVEWRAGESADQLRAGAAL